MRNAERSEGPNMTDQTAKVLSVDLYAWWKAARAGNMGAISVDDPRCGFYRVSKFKNGPLVPLAIYPCNGEIIGHLDGENIDSDRLNQLWPFAARHHVDEAAWREVAENRGKWPDIDATVDMQRGIGDNSGALDDAATIKEQIESASAGIKEYAVISDDATRDRAQTLRSRLLELRSEADRHLEKDKRPHLSALETIRGKWNPLVEAAQAGADAIRAAMKKWETKKLNDAAEAQRKIDIERREGERKAAETGATIAPTVAPPPAPITTKFKGGAGRAASVAKVRVITEVTNWDQVYQVFRDTPDVKALLRKLADRAVANGHTFAGVTIEEQADVR